MGAWYNWDGDDLILSVRAQPKASRDEIIGPHGDSLKVRVTAPPIDGEANQHLQKFLAKAFGVSRSAVILESGESAREKRFRIQAPKKLPDSAEIAEK